MKTFIIAEIGVNHNGSLQKAKKLIDQAHLAGASAVKFQIFKTEKLTIKKSKKANYQYAGTKKNETYFKMLKKYELSEINFQKIFNYSKQKNIKFIASSFDNESLFFLTNKLRLKLIKIASSEISNYPFLLEHSLKNSNLILSTGMSNLKEIKMALSVLSYGYLCCKKKIKPNPTLINFKKSFNSRAGQKLLKEKVSLLHCVSEYPAPNDQLNLLSIKFLKKNFRLKIGFSDHSNGTLASETAVALGAEIIEKHLTLNKNSTGPDHKASLSPFEFKNLVNRIKVIEHSLGEEKKIIMKCEIANKKIASKSLFALKNIYKGEIFTENNVTIKRPFIGLSPMNYWKTLGKKSKKTYKIDDPIL